MSNQPQCDRIITYNNDTAVIAGYEGIPQNLLINSVCWIVLLLLFSFLRMIAWDYGRIAMRKTHESKWANIFYSDIRRSTSSDNIETYYPVHEYGFCSWLRSSLTLKTADIQHKAGTDAVQYLRFQLYLIVYTAVTMVFSLAVILPLNMHGDLKSPDLHSFGVTTISNISAKSSMLWGHVVLGIIFVIFAFILMQHFSLHLKAGMKSTVSHNTLMISGISRSNCRVDLLMQHFEEAFPDCHIKDIQVCFDIRRLISLDNQLSGSRLALHQARKQLELTDVRPEAVPRACGWFCYQCQVGCRSCSQSSCSRGDPDIEGRPLTEVNRHCHCRCCCPDPVDAITFYEEETNRLKALTEQETKTAVNRMIGIAFVTFTRQEDANRVFKAHHSICPFLTPPPASIVSERLRSKRWTVEFASTPNNIIWMNLSLTRTLWWIKAVGINIAIFFLIFFLTTPTYVLNLIYSLKIPEFFQIESSFVARFIPSIILWAVSALLPLLVYYSERWLGYWTRSTMHFAVMMKTFVILILMVLLLPSLGLTSIPALLQWLFPQMRMVPLEDNSSISANTTTKATPLIPIGPQSFQWECVFMPDNGAFFVNYVITASLIGSAMELVGLPGLIVYAIRMMCVRSAAERITVLQASQWEFDFGVYYAWTLCVFAVVTTYSILCPLITPFGLLYLILRHLVERHNLFFVYLPSHIDSRIHWLAVNFMLFSVLLLQFNLFMFISLRLSIVSRTMAIIALVGLLLALVFFLFSVISGWLFFGSQSARRRIGGAAGHLPPPPADLPSPLVPHGDYADDRDFEEVISKLPGRTDTASRPVSKGESHPVTISTDDQPPEEEDADAWTNGTGNQMNFVTSVLQRLAASSPVPPAVVSEDQLVGPDS